MHCGMNNSVITECNIVGGDWQRRDVHQLCFELQFVTQFRYLLADQLHIVKPDIVLSNPPTPSDDFMGRQHIAKMAETLYDDGLAAPISIIAVADWISHNLSAQVP